MLVLMLLVIHFVVVVSVVLAGNSSEIVAQCQRASGYPVVIILMVI